MAFNKDWFDENRSSINVDEFQEQIKDNAQWPIFVYDWINKTPNTEAGLRPSNDKRITHYQWTEIVKGNESIYLTPHNATELIDHNGTGERINGTNKVDGSYYQVKYNKDDATVIYGMKDTNGGGNNFNSTDFGGFGDFTTISDSETITFMTDTKVGKDLLTQFFFIPDVALLSDNYKAGIYNQVYNDNDIYYIESYTNYYSNNGNGEFIYSEITFSNIQFNMAQSGQVIEQHIYLASPGAGYLVPKILFDENGVPYEKSKGWEWNTAYTQDRGVKTIQFDVTGNFAIAGLEIYGHPVDPEHNDINNKRWYAPRRLLIENMKLPLNENFYKVSPNSPEFYIMDAKLTATNDLGAYKHMVQDIAGDKRLSYQGIISTTKATTLETNSTGYTINDAQFGYTDNFVDGSLQVDGKTKNTDLDNIYTADSQWFYDGALDDGSDGLGQKKFSLKDIHRNPNKDHSVKQMLNIMSFALSPINKLPFEINSKLTWSIQDMSGFGKFANTPLLGMSPTWRNIVSNTNKLMPQLQTLPMLVNKGLYELGTNSVYASNITDKINKNNAYFAWDMAQLGTGLDQTELGKLPMDFFQKNESDLLGAVLSNKSNSTSFTITLTDKMWAEKYDVKTGKDLGQELISTVMLNQELDGVKYKVKGDSYSLDNFNPENEKNIITDVNGGQYIIDSIGIKGLGDGDLRITCFNIDIDDIPIGVDYHNYISFQTYMKTTAAYKNNQIREWFSTINTSYLDALDKYLNTKFDWPKALPDPRPESHLKDLNGVSTQGDFVIYDARGRATGNGLTADENDTNYNYVKDENSKAKMFADSSFDLEIADFKDYGYKTWDEVVLEYEKLNIVSDDLYSFIGRMETDESWLDGVSQGNYATWSYLDKEKNRAAIITQLKIENEIYLKDVDGYIPGTKTTNQIFKLTQGNFADGSYWIDEQFPAIGNVIKRLTTTYYPDNIRESGWYCFYYHNGTKLMIKMWYEANIKYATHTWYHWMYMPPVEVYQYANYVYSAIYMGSASYDAWYHDNWIQKCKVRYYDSDRTVRKTYLDNPEAKWNFRYKLTSYQIK